MQHPAPLPEDRRDRSRPCAGRCAPPSHHRRRRAVREARRLHQSRNVRVPGRCLRSPGRPALRVHRGERAASGRAHGHRGGDRRRSRARPDPAGSGRDIERAGVGRAGDRPTAWLRHPDAGEHGNDRAGWFGAAGRRHVDGLRGAERTGRADGWVRVCGLSHQQRVRLVARQGHRPGAGLRGRGGAVLARPQRVPAGRRRHQHPVPPQRPGACRLRRRKRPHPLGR